MVNSPAVWLPDELEEAWQLKQHLGPQACFIAGGTLMQTDWGKGHAYPPNLISLENIQSMQGWGKQVSNGETVTQLGALMTLDVCRKDPSLFNNLPLIVEAARNIAAPAIRNKATIGGNIAGGSGDTLPALLVMDATLSLYDGKELLKSLADFIKDGDTFINSILVWISISEKIEAYNSSYFYKKIGHREAFSPSIITISGICHLNEQKEVEYIRLAACGSMTPPQRLIGCEQYLSGSTLSNECLNKVYQAIKDELNTTTDAFSTAEYKKTIAANMIVSEIVRLAG